MEKPKDENNSNLFDEDVEEDDNEEDANSYINRYGGKRKSKKEQNKAKLIGADENQFV